MPLKPAVVVCEWCKTRFAPDPRPQAKARRWCSSRCRVAAWEAEAKKTYTGTCAQCGAAVKYPRKLCSEACRAKAAVRPGYTTGTYLCQGCGKTVTRTANDARRQKYCGHVCEMRHRAAPVAVPDLDPAFGNWFAGFVDGEGCFSATAGHYNFHVRFHITLREDDAAILEELRERLGFGRIHYSHPPSALPNSKPQASFYCGNLPECLALVAIFRTYPLRAKKARDFAFWSTLVERMRDGLDDRDEIALQVARLKDVRAFRGRSTYRLGHSAVYPEHPSPSR